MIREMLAGMAVLSMITVLAGCERQEPVADTGAAAEVVGWSPEAEMRATLSDLAHAQMRYRDEHGVYTDDLALLIEEYDYVPVGDATVTIRRPGELDDGYLAVALHPLAEQRCEMAHTITPVEGRETVGEIECTAE